MQRPSPPRQRTAHQEYLERHTAITIHRTRSPTPQQHALSRSAPNAPFGKRASIRSKYWVSAPAHQTHQTHHFRKPISTHQNKSSKFILYIYNIKILCHPFSLSLHQQQNKNAPNKNGAFGAFGAQGLKAFIYCGWRLVRLYGAFGTHGALTRLPPHQLSSNFKTARKAFCGTLTLPICFMRFLPRFCFSRSFLFRDTSPP